MNELMTAIVKETAKRHKAKAKKNNWQFALEVQKAYNLYMVSNYGVDLVQRAKRLFRVLRPDCFDDDGFLKEKWSYDLDLALTGIGLSILEKQIEKNPDLHFCSDWGDMPILIAEPQLKLF